MESHTRAYCAWQDEYSLNCSPTPEVVCKVILNGDYLWRQSRTINNKARNRFPIFYNKNHPRTKFSSKKDICWSINHDFSLAFRSLCLIVFSHSEIASFANPPECRLLIRNLDPLDEKPHISSSPTFRVGTQNSIGIFVGTRQRAFCLDQPSLILLPERTAFLDKIALLKVLFVLRKHKGRPSPGNRCLSRLDGSLYIAPLFLI